MKKIFNWILDKWLAGFITAGIFFVLKLYIDLPAESKTNFFSFQWFVDLMTTNIPFWIILVIILVVILLTVLKSQSKKSNMYGFLDAPKNHFEKYNSDVFGVHKTQWCWHYEWRAFERKFDIANLKPVCKQCGTTMDIDNSFYSYNAECHKCKLEGRQYRFPLTEDITDIEKEIIRKIQNNEVKL